MKPGRDGNGEWLRPATDEEPEALTDEEITAAVASDPDAAPILTEEEWDAFFAREAERDKWGVARLRRRLGIAQIVFADRYKVPLGTLRNWKQGLCEPDRAAKVLLAAIATDPEMVARCPARARPRVPNYGRGGAGGVMFAASFISSEPNSVTRNRPMPQPSELSWAAWTEVDSV